MYPFLSTVDGAWTEWSLFNTCSVSCGGGTQSRTRSCGNPAPSMGGAFCPGQSTETQACNPTPCPGSIIILSMIKEIAEACQECNSHYFLQLHIFVRMLFIIALTYISS